MKKLLETSPTFEEEINIVYSKKKMNACFLSTMNDRRALIEQYKKLFYSRPNANTKQAFDNLCVRPRTKRYANRLSFNYLVVKNLQCESCVNKCVYDALKKFYLMDKKCVAQVDSLVAKESS